MTILEQCAAARRELPIALAQSYMLTKPGAPRQEALGRIFAPMTPAWQLQCRAELLRCHEAKRARTVAEVAA